MKSFLGHYCLVVFALSLALLFPGLLLAGQDLKIEPNLASVTEHNVPDASVTIIHILKIPNRLDFEKVKDNSALGLWLEKSEKECYQILTKVRLATGERKIYLDALTPEMERDIIAPVFANFQVMKRNNGISPEMSSLVQRHKRYSAVIAQGYEGLCAVKGIEDFDLLMKERLPENIGKEQEFIIARGQHVVEMLATLPGTKILAWDARHRFLPIINVWNVKHPEIKIRLIEIVPSSIPNSVEEFRIKFKLVQEGQGNK